MSIKIIGLVFLLSVLASQLIGSSGAYYADTAVIAHNSFSAAIPETLLSLNSPTNPSVVFTITKVAEDSKTQSAPFIPQVMPAEEPVDSVTLPPAETTPTPDTTNSTEQPNMPEVTTISP